MGRMTGYSWSQLKRLIAQYREKRWLGRTASNRHTFITRYTPSDVLLLAQTDEAHQTLSGPATKKLFERAYQVYGDTAYDRLAFISVSHLYNLRKGDFYQRQRRHFTKTQKSAVQIGTRRKPNPEGEPGYIRIDTVHQGDKDKQKGVYPINAVDEVTQFEVICSVEKISENYLIPVLEEILAAFPLAINNFHYYLGRYLADQLKLLSGNKAVIANGYTGAGKHTERTSASLRGTKQPRVQSSEPWVASYLAMTDLCPLQPKLGTLAQRREKQPRKHGAQFHWVASPFAALGVAMTVFDNNNTNANEGYGRSFGTCGQSHGRNVENKKTFPTLLPTLHPHPLS